MSFLKKSEMIRTAPMRSRPHGKGSSDGLFNLGSALSFVQVLPAGVYIAMNGTCFPWDHVRENRERGEFEEIPAV
jgi:L-asparaginase